MSFFDMSKEIYGYNSDHNTVAKYHFECDTVTDLPSYSAILTDNNVKLLIGSTAHVIETDENYMMKSDGTWVKQKGEFELSLDAAAIDYDNTTSGMTADNVQDAIDEIADLNETQDRALVELYGEDANQQLEINYAINTGVKNKLIITNQNTTLTVNGITFVKNDDQTITATGTATANADYPLNAAQPLELGRSYILSGCPNGGGADNFLLRQQSGAIDYGDGATFTAESSSGNFYIRIRNGYAIQGSITFKPMLRLNEIRNNTFEPYAPTNRELYETKITLADVFGIGTLIPDYDDVNDYIVGGKFYGGNSAGNTVLNLPVPNGNFNFTLTVINATPSATIQIIKICNIANDPYLFIRRKTTSTWQSWYRFEGTPVALTQSVQSLRAAPPLDEEEVIEDGPIENEER